MAGNGSPNCPQRASILNLRFSCQVAVGGGVQRFINGELFADCITEELAARAAALKEIANGKK